MHGTALGDMDEPLALGLVQIAPYKVDFAVDLVEHALFGFAIRTILGVDPLVTKPYLDLLQRVIFPLRIHAECNGRSGSQSGE